MITIIVFLLTQINMPPLLIKGKIPSICYQDEYTIHCYNSESVWCE